MLVTIPLRRRGRDRWNISKERNYHPQSVDLAPGNGHFQYGKSQIILFYAREKRVAGKDTPEGKSVRTKGNNEQVKAGGIHLSIVRLTDLCPFTGLQKDGILGRVNR